MYMPSQNCHMYMPRGGGEGGGGGGGGYSGFQVTGMIDGFMGVFDRKIWHLFVFEWLDLRRDFWGIKKTEDSW